MSEIRGIETIEVNGEWRKLGLTQFSPTSALPQYAQSGPMWTREQIIEAVTDSSWTPAVELFGDDWIRDQDGRGACAGYAAASALERARAKRGLAFVELSGDAAYAAVNGGVDRGSALEANMQNIVHNGIPPASLVPKWEYRRSRIPDAAYQAGERFKGFEAFFIDSELELASALAAGFTCVLAAHAGNGGRSPDGLIDWKNGVGNHSIVCDDLRYRNGHLEFQIANSWGLRWGERGRGWLSWRDHLSKPNQYHKFYCIRSTIDDPEGDNPPEVRGE